LLPVGHIDPSEGTGVTQRKAGIFSVPSGDDVVVRLTNSKIMLHL